MEKEENIADQEDPDAQVAEGKDFATDEEKEKEDEEGKKEDDRMSFLTCLSCSKCSQPIKNPEKERYVSRIG